MGMGQGAMGHRLWYFMACLSVMLCTEAVARPTLHIATSDSPPLSLPDGTGFFDRLVREAFNLDRQR